MGSVAARIRQAREEAGLSREALAVAVGVSFSTIGRWEKGDTSPSIAKLQLLAGATAKPIAFFVSVNGGQEAA